MTLGGVVEARNAKVAKGAVKTGGCGELAVAQSFQVSKDMHGLRRMSRPQHRIISRRRATRDVGVAGGSDKSLDRVTTPRRRHEEKHERN